MKNLNKISTLIIASITITACNGGSGGESSGNGSTLTINPSPFQQFYPNGSPFNPNNFGSAKTWSTGSGDLNFTLYGSANYGGGISLTLSGTVNLNNTTCAILTDSNQFATLTLTNCSQSISNNTYMLTATATGGGVVGEGTSNLSISSTVLPSGTYLAPSNCYNISISGTTLSATCLSSNGLISYTRSANISACPNGPVQWDNATKVLGCI